MNYYIVNGHVYRLYCDDPCPFAIMCDKENEYTAPFDQVVLFQPGPRPYFNKFGY